jgi:predicted nuclease of predicted toxin-antitoxin system
VAEKAKGFTVFVDRSLGGKIVPNALREICENVIAHDTEFPDPATPDEVWLARAGKAGWVVLTNDKRIRYRPREQAALRDSGALVVVLGAGNLSGQDTVRLLVEAFPAIAELVLSSERPALFKLDRDGKLKRLPDENG